MPKKEECYVQTTCQDLKRSLSTARKIIVPKPLALISCHLITDIEMQDRIFALLWFGLTLVHPSSVSLCPPFGMVMLILLLSHHCTHNNTYEALFNTSSWQRIWGLKTLRRVWNNARVLRLQGPIQIGSFTLNFERGKNLWGKIRIYDDLDMHCPM